MIKNIIFDLGNVLIKYTPENFLENNVKKERQEKFIETVFKKQGMAGFRQRNFII